MPRAANIEKVTEGLMQMIVHGGSAKAASRVTGISESTLTDWKNKTHSARYRELEAKYATEVEEQIIHAARVNALKASEIEAELLERVRQAQDRDVPQALRAVADSRAKSVDKLMTLTGRPQAITENRDMASVIKFLADKKVIRVIEGTAVEDGS